MLSRQAKLSGYERYEFTGRPKTFHTFADLAQYLTTHHLSPQLLKHYLDALRVLFEMELERELQLEETPEAFNARLIDMGMPPEGFSEAMALRMEANCG